MGYYPVWSQVSTSWYLLGGGEIDCDGGPSDMKVMTAEAMGANLETFVDEVRAVGAEPILITSLTRRNFNADNTTLNDTLEPWANGKFVSHWVSRPAPTIFPSNYCGVTRKGNPLA